MTGFDLIVLLVVGVAAIGGFLRGFVQEILSLAAWGVAILAIYNLHSPIYEWLLPRVGTPSGAATLAFVVLLLIPYAGMKLISGRLGETTRTSLLGPIDRVLGFGFGAFQTDFGQHGFGLLVALGTMVMLFGTDVEPANAG